MGVLKKCWICGGDANSGEHRVKKSDLRLVLGPISQKDPVFLNGGMQKNRRIGGLDNDHLKFAKSLCEGCNNSRTQSADLAWERLSSAISVDGIDAESANALLADQRFMQEVHKYFMKHMGCVLAEGIPLPNVSAELSNCLMRDRNSKYLMLQFGRTVRPQAIPLGHTNPHTFGKLETPDDVVILYKYVVGRSVVTLVYATRVRAPGWNPHGEVAPEIRSVAPIHEREIRRRSSPDQIVTHNGTVEFVMSADDQILSIRSV